MFRSVKLFAVLGILFPIIIGCSFSPGRYVESPLDPNSGERVSASGHSTRFLWGIYEISIDPSASIADVVPIRTTQGHLNALKFLEISPCNSCVAVLNLMNLGPKEWMVDVQLRHPFLGLDKYTGFDVQGIVMFDPAYTFPSSGLSVSDGSASGSGGLLNPDGFTTLFNPIDYPPGSAEWPAWEYQQGKLATFPAPESLLNPYIAYSADTLRRHFKCGSTDTQSLHLRFPTSGPLKFGYAINANWAPAYDDPPDVPDDFPPDANMPEAFHVEFAVLNNDLWCDSTGAGGGDIRFDLKVYDHQDPHPVSEGGDVAEFRWEVPGMTEWVPIFPQTWEDGEDSMGPYVGYTFVEAPVPDESGYHRALFAVVDKVTGLKDLPQTAYILAGISVSDGISCWEPGVLLTDEPSSEFQAHLSMQSAHWVDANGVLHLYYVDEDFHIHHLTYQDVVLSDDEILPGVQAYQLNVLPDSLGGLHLLYADDPTIRGGNIVYRYIDSSGISGSPVILSSTPMEDQFQTTMATAPDGTMLALWMDSHTWPSRRLCGAWFNGSGWTPEMTLSSGNLPEGWIDPAVVADSSSIFHICYCMGDDQDLYYMRFDHGVPSAPELVEGGPNQSGATVMTIDSLDRIYAVFMDNRLGKMQGYFKMRDPVSGQWSDEVDFIGHNYECRRFVIQLLPDGRLGVVWTDFRDLYGRSLFSKTFDPFLPEIDIQQIPDGEIDEDFTAQKVQVWLTADPSGALHLIWSDLRDITHFQLYYSTCTP